MTSTPDGKPAETECDCDCIDEWDDFEFILTAMIGKIGVIRYLDQTEDDEFGTAAGEFFSMAKNLHEMAEDLYAAFMSGSTCVYCGREPQSNWDEEEHHDDIVFFKEDGKTKTAHRFCRDEALRNEAAAGVK